MKKYKCPCCEKYTLSEKAPGSYEICPVCYWEDDDVQFNDPYFEGGANEMNLKDAKNNYNKFDAIDKRYADKVRKPYYSEINTYGDE